MVLLYVDLLGMKARWQTAGVAGAKAAYQTLDLVVRHALGSVPEDTAESVVGGIQSDAAALACREVSDAVALGLLVFKETFRRCGALDAGRERHWIRGVIVEMAEAELESTQTLGGPASQVAKRVFSDDLLEAINIEQSGFRGQRLLVAESLIDPKVESRFAVSVGDDRSLSMGRGSPTLTPFPVSATPFGCSQETKRPAILTRGGDSCGGQWRIGSAGLGMEGLESSPKPQPPSLYLQSAMR